MMRNATALLVALGLGAFAAGCDVDQTREGEMPEVEVQEGQLPEYDVDTAEIESGTERRTIEVPEVDVETREETIETPTLDIEMPDDEPEGVQPQE